MKLLIQSYVSRKSEWNLDSHGIKISISTLVIRRRFHKKVQLSPSYIEKVYDGSQFLWNKLLLFSRWKHQETTSKLAFSKIMQSLFEVFALDTIWVKQINKQKNKQTNKQAIKQR